MSNITFIPTPDLRQMAWELRFPIEKVTRQQSLAEHTYLVAMTVDLLAHHINWGGDYAVLLREALRHDLDELVSGDIPTPVKKVLKAFPEAWEAFEFWTSAQLQKKLPWWKPKEVNDEISWLISIADTLEAVCYLHEEAASGNRLIGGVLEYLKGVLLSKVDKIPLSLAASKPRVIEFVAETLVRAENQNITVC